MNETPAGQHKDKSAGLMSSEIYDVVKFIAMIALPAIGTAYFALAGIWGLPDADQVIGTITVVDTGLGALLRVSKAKFDAAGGGTDGTMVVSEGEEPNTKLVGLKIDTDPVVLAAQKTVTFQVKNT